MSTGIIGLASLHDPKLKELALKLVADHIRPTLEHLGKDRLDQQKAQTRAENYASTLLRTIVYVRTFLTTDHPQHIRRFYKSQTFEYRRDTVRDELKEICQLGRAIAIIGHAGTGKSCTLKRLCLQAIEDGGYLPVFLEFRRMIAFDPEGKQRRYSIKEAISYSWFLTGLQTHEKFVNELLRAKNVIVFVDGFDETPRSWRSPYANELLTLMEQFPDVQWIISSRPDEMVNHLAPVRVLKPRPLSLGDACDVVERFDNHEEFQKEFIGELRRELFERHKSFASNPLLLCVLFLTYRTYGRISTTPARFYSEVFEALSSRHDSRKQGYERQLFSALGRADFESAVQSFCFRTATDELLRFLKPYTREMCLDLLRAEGHTEIEPDSFLKDLTQSVSILVEDGLEYVFLHRALQEFLAVKFLLGLPKEDQQRALLAVVKDPVNSLAVPTLFEIDPELVESTIVIPILNEILSAVAELRIDSTEGAIRFISRAYDDRIVENALSGFPFGDPSLYELSISEFAELAHTLYPGVLRAEVLRMEEHIQGQSINNGMESLVRKHKIREQDFFDELGVRDSQRRDRIPALGTLLSEEWRLEGKIPDWVHTYIGISPGMISALSLLREHLETRKLSRNSRRENRSSWVQDLIRTRKTQT